MTNEFLISVAIITTPFLLAAGYIFFKILKEDKKVKGYSKLINWKLRM